ncbi:MAG TPA: TonB-dependent receptor [Acidobacteriaceae bacterium]|nr:TonB-dependent receptor [Acidobacteriaceae bacterium]
MRRAVLLLIFLPFRGAIGQDLRPAPVPLDAKQGHLAGRVADPSDALIPGASVTIHLLKSGVERTTATDKVGRFQFENLPFGQYTINIRRDGFAEFRGKFTLTAEKVSANLDARLKIATDEEQVDVDTRTDTLDPNNNPDGITLKGKEIDQLPDDPNVLSQELNGLSGSAQSTIYVDGFSGGQIPPKNMIREIRINQNAYSAKNDTDPIGGLIEIFTKPGTDKLHGYFSVFGNDSALNAKNPFYPDQPGYHSYASYGNLSGALTKRSSYFVTGDQAVIDTNQTISAEILDANLNQVHFTQALPSKQPSFYLNPRFDFQLTKNDTLSFRYQISHSTQNNAGESGINLASRGYNSKTVYQTLQLINSQTIGTKIVNETRFQYVRSRTSQNPYSTALSIAVQGAFNDGGSPSGHSQDNQDRYEFQDYVSVAPHNHYLNLGVRLRSVRDANNSSANYNGQYTFPTLDAYQITEQILQANPHTDPAALDPQIRAAGGGASQFSITAGNSSVAVAMTDLGLFYEDDWKWKPNFTLSYGVRYEAQNYISDHRDFAPRLGFAWNFGPKKSPFSLGGGNGLFYHRFPASSIMNAERQNGVNQQRYVQLNPATFPNIPDLSTLSAQVASSTYQINPHYRAEVVYVASINLSHPLFKQGRASVNYWYARGMHDPLIRNINAPLPGTYDPSDPSSGVRPYGGTNNIYRYDSAGLSRYYRLMPSFTLHNSKGASLSVNYQLVWYTADADPGNAGGFPSNQYNISVDKGPGYLDTRHNISAFASLPLPWHFSTNFYVFGNSPAPFNIVLGQDLNGDSIFNDRPAFATDLSRPSVVKTQWGTFDTDPLPTQTIIPYNYGRAPGRVNDGIMITRNFSFGPEQKAAPGAKGPLPRKFTLGISAISQNPLNHMTLGTPNPTLGSPLFGQSLNISSSPRELEFQTNLRF